MDTAALWKFELERFVVFCRDVIEPAMYTHTTSLEASAWQCDEPVSYDEAVKGDYRPVSIGWAWGPRWSTAWFRVRGIVPESMRGKRVVVRFSTDTESLVWMPSAATGAGIGNGGVPYHGLDNNRDAVTLYESAQGGEVVDLYIEAACNHMFGDRGLQWDPPEVHRRWNSSTPGLFERCELAVLNTDVWRLKWTYAFAMNLAKELAPDSARGRQVLGVLRRVTNMIPDDRVAETAPAALAALTSVLGPAQGRAGGGATLCHAVGHAHIDTAWLWPIRETKRKCLRTFSTVLRNMERYPEYHFLCSQAQQYVWVEERSPELFAQIKKRVSEGRWEPGGAMWIEPDCTCPSGESLMRQMLYADRYWRGKFGDERGRQRFLYLPDTFGFPPQLPQIMRCAGLDTFITNKLHWNSHNVFPHTTFEWRGLDGSVVLAHNTPGMDYNASNTPKELIRGEKTHKNKDLPSTGSPDTAGARWLQPFGFGDGGGGATDWSIEYAGLASDCDGLPRVRQSSAGAFLDGLHRDVAHARREDPSSVHTHDGELYLELHRGTYTTHARIKQANRECEELLRQAEILTFAGPTRASREEERSARADLDKAWKLVLLNQFHDILPGSSIAWVYDDAMRDYGVVRAIVGALIERGAARWVAHVSSGPGPANDCVLNLSNARSEGTSLMDGRVISTGTIEPMSIQASSRATAELAASTITKDTGGLRRSGLRFEHARAVLELDTSGRIVDFRSVGDNSTSAKAGQGLTTRALVAPINTFALYEDRPRLWDAWDIDEEIEHKRQVLDDACDVSVMVDTPSLASVRTHRSFGRGSTLTQVFAFVTGARRVHVTTEIDWREEHRLLRVLFPTPTRHPLAGAKELRAGTQFGWRAVPTDRNTSQRRAAFEMPFQGFVGVPALGMTLIFPDRYGVSPSPECVGISLLRSTRYPDPKADIGLHRFEYAIALDNDVANVDDLVRRPARLLSTATRDTQGQSSWTVADFGGLRCEAIKPAAGDDRLIVRLVNDELARPGARVRWGLPVSSVEAVDGLERPTVLEGFSHDRTTSESVFDCRPFQIVSLAVTRAD